MHATLMFDGPMRQGDRSWVLTFLAEACCVYKLKGDYGYPYTSPWATDLYLFCKNGVGFEMP